MPNPFLKTTEISGFYGFIKYQFIKLPLKSNFSLTV